MDVAIISDTHVPSRASGLPAAFRDRIAAADHVLHAGDMDSKGAFADVRDLARDLTAVRGNMDPNLGLERVTSVELGGVTFVLTHGTGADHGYEDRVAAAVRSEADSDAVGVSGHTHEVLDVEHDGVRLLNPGSATGAAPADRATMMTGTAADGSLAVQVHETDPVGR